MSEQVNSYCIHSRKFYSEEANKSVLRKWAIYLAALKGGPEMFTPAYDPNGSPPDSRIGQMLFKTFEGKVMKHC